MFQNLFNNFLNFDISTRIQMIFSFFAINPGLFLGLMFLTGCLIGSFLNVLIYRLPKQLLRSWLEDCCQFLELDDTDQKIKTYLTNFRKKYQLETLAKQDNIIFARSHCPHCQNTIAWYDNIPLVSYLILKSKCRNCHVTISGQYFIVELLTASLFTMNTLYFGMSIALLFSIIWVSTLITASWIDFNYQIIPENLNTGLLWIGLFGNYYFQIFCPIREALLGAVLGYFSLWLFYHGYKLITGKEGMGFGDFKLNAALGAWLGWTQLPLLILLASGIGAIAGIIWLLASKQNKNTPIAFGPFLALSGWICSIWGHQINQIYLNWANF